MSRYNFQVRNWGFVTPNYCGYFWGEGRNVGGVEFGLFFQQIINLLEERKNFLNPRTEFIVLLIINMKWKINRIFWMSLSCRNVFAYGFFLKTFLIKYSALV